MYFIYIFKCPKYVKERNTLYFIAYQIWAYKDLYLLNVLLSRDNHISDADKIDLLKFAHVYIAILIDSNKIYWIHQML